MMNAELDRVNRELEALRTKQIELEADNFKQRILPVLADAIGKTFVYRGNSYGREGKWDTFRKVVDVVFSEYHAWLLFESCQIDAEGKARLETDSGLVASNAQEAFPNLEYGWKECPPEEYKSARQETLDTLINPSAFRKYLERR